MFRIVLGRILYVSIDLEMVHIYSIALGRMLYDPKDPDVVK